MANESALWQIVVDRMSNYLTVGDFDNFAKLHTLSKALQTWSVDELYFLDRWDRMTDKEKEIAVMRQEFTTKFVECTWDNSPYTVKYYILKNQKVSTIFIRSRWHELDSNLRFLSVQCQPLVNELSKTELIILLVDNDLRIRTLALKRLKEISD